MKRMSLIASRKQHGISRAGIGLFVLISLLSSTVFGQGEVRVLDLQTLTDLKLGSEGQRESGPGSFLLPPEPLEPFAADSLDTTSRLVFEVARLNQDSAVDLAFFLPPAPEDVVDAINYEYAPPPPEGLSEPALHGFQSPGDGCTATDCYDTGCLESCRQRGAFLDRCRDWDGQQVLESSILATHRGLEFVHHCFHDEPQSGWIFWKHEYEKQPGPLWCALQYHTVTLRHSSMYLKGCMPEGYSLSHFIRCVPNHERHGTPLAANGFSVPDGTIAEAQQLDGPETKPLSQISMSIAPPVGELPEDHAANRFEQIPTQLQLPGAHREWCGTTFYWQASLLNHQPLYFEDVNLERHGFSYGLLQPLVSGAKFFVRIPALPYLMTAQPLQETQYTLGETRPGNHASYVCERPPLRWDAAAVQAGATLGLIFIIP